MLIGNDQRGHRVQLAHAVHVRVVVIISARPQHQKIAAIGFLAEPAKGFVEVLATAHHGSSGNRSRGAVSLSRLCESIDRRKPQQRWRKGVWSRGGTDIASRTDFKDMILRKTDFVEDMIFLRLSARTIYRDRRCRPLPAFLNGMNSSRRDRIYDSPDSVRTMGASADRARIPVFCQPSKSSAHHASANRYRSDPSEIGAASGMSRKTAATITDRSPLAGAGSEIVTSFRVDSLPSLSRAVDRTDHRVRMEPSFRRHTKEGPFKSFHHRHELEEETRDQVRGTVVRDVIDYDVGFGWLGNLAQKFFIRRQLQRTFEYRQKALEKLLG